MNAVMGLVTMARRAGKLKMGMDMMKDACENGEAKAVVTATDISEKSLKEVKFVCKKHGVKIYSADMSMQDIGYDLGKRVGIMAVCDKGFAKKLSTLLTEIENDTQLEY